MTLDVSNISFGASPRVHLRRRQVKRLNAKINELEKYYNTLKEDCKPLETALKKVTPLAYDHPDMPKVAELFRLRFNVGHSLFFGSYKEYKNAQIEYAKKAVENPQLLPYVTIPIKGSASLFSKTGMNIAKNILLDKFRPKTTEEKVLIEIGKKQHEQDLLRQSLGYRR